MVGPAAAGSGTFGPSDLFDRFEMSEMPAEDMAEERRVIAAYRAAVAAAAVVAVDHLLLVRLDHHPVRLRAECWTRERHGDFAVLLGQFLARLLCVEDPGLVGEEFG